MNRRTMQTTFIKHKRTIGLAIIVIVLYFLLRPKQFSYSHAVFIPKIHPSDAWEFVADFSNMKHLNPTVVSFNILSESGNYEHWRYSVEYVENLSHWPYLSNVATAHFNVKAVPRQNVFYIVSTHNTCFFLGLICFQSSDEFRFSENSSTNKGAFCEELTQYHCPLLMARFCEREVKFQRDAIMNNLKKHFVEKNS